MKDHKRELQNVLRRGGGEADKRWGGCSSQGWKCTRLYVQMDVETRNAHVYVTDLCVYTHGACHGFRFNRTGGKKQPSISNAVRPTKRLVKCLFLPSFAEIGRFSSNNTLTLCVPGVQAPGTLGSRPRLRTHRAQGPSPSGQSVASADQL